MFCLPQSCQLPFRLLPVAYSRIVGGHKVNGPLQTGDEGFRIFLAVDDGDPARLPVCRQHHMKRLAKIRHRSRELFMAFPLRFPLLPLLAFRKPSSRSPKSCWRWPLNRERLRLRVTQKNSLAVCGPKATIPRPVPGPISSTLTMIPHCLKTRLSKDRPLTLITLRIPADVGESLKTATPHKGFSGYQALLKA